MSNGLPMTDRELLLAVRDKTNAIHKEQDEKFGVVFKKLDNYGGRLSEAEKDILVAKGERTAIEKEVKRAPDVYKAILFFGSVIVILQALGVILK